MRPIKVTAPLGTIVNCQPPAATWGRVRIAHLFPEIIFGALEGVMPQAILASNGGSPANEVYLHGRSKRDGRPFFGIQAHSGGFGASHQFDGYSALCFPNNTRNIPVEVSENESPLRFLRKEFITDSAGPGRRRGGFGQEVEFAVLNGEQGPADYVEGSIQMNGRVTESVFPVFGRCGGEVGRGGGLWLNDRDIDHGIHHRFSPNDRIRFQIGGGGGFGDPFEREIELVASDVRAGLVSVEAAAADYGVVVDPKTFAVDVAATNARRAKGRGASL
jgi:N-methylhydantoinase B/oxoprolinase/acetone carboxylase alpha subunit